MQEEMFGAEVPATHDTCVVALRYSNGR